MEKRKRTRITAHFHASVWIRGEEIKVDTQNISLTGILCTSDPRFRAGDNCRVVLFLNEEIKITLDAKILRDGQEETVIRFLAMDEDSFTHLKKLLQLNAENADLIEEELRNPAFD